MLSSKNDEFDGIKTFEVYFPYITLASNIFKQTKTLICVTIPNYFNNSETPIICYKYNKPIRSMIFNFNKIVNDLDIDSNTPAS